MGNATGPCGDQVPCFTCCDDVGGQRRVPSTMKSLRTPGHTVELCVSPLAGLNGAAGYHSSILIAGEEFYFSPMGIINSPCVQSHKKNPQMKRIHMGLTRYSGTEMVEVLERHFPPGHYDLLRKNCNSFSDCALYFLVEQRLDWSFRTLERFGKLADDHAGIIQSISGGEYAPNPRAVDFNVEAVIVDIDAERETCEGSGPDSQTVMDLNDMDRDNGENDSFDATGKLNEYAAADVLQHHVARSPRDVPRLSPRSRDYSMHSSEGTLNSPPKLDIPTRNDFKSLPLLY